MASPGSGTHWLNLFQRTVPLFSIRSLIHSTLKLLANQACLC